MQLTISMQITQKIKIDIGNSPPKKNESIKAEKILVCGWSSKITVMLSIFNNIFDSGTEVFYCSFFFFPSFFFFHYFFNFEQFLNINYA